MSVSSILAFVLAAAVKRKTGNDDVVAKLEARIVELEDDIATANLQARRDQELVDMWRERALANVPAVIAAPRPAGPDFRPAQFAALQQQAGLQHAQYNAQQAMNAQYIQQGLLGAQNLIDAELWCNCVPSRSQVWAASDPE
jgi:hypothetical protein